MAWAGRLGRALPTLMRVGFAGAMAYRSEMVVWVLATNVPLIMMLLWTAVAADAPVGRFGEAEFAAYFLAALVVRLLTSCWLVWELNFEIRQGVVAMRLLRPLHPLVSYAADQLAAFPLRVVLALPFAVGALAWLGAGQLNRDPAAWALLPLALVGAWLLIFFVMAVIGTLAFYWESSMALFDLWLGLFFVLSGYTVPLDLFPAWLRDVVVWLPFRFSLSFPVEMMLGLLDRGALLRCLAVQWLYVAGMAAAALGLWRAGTRRYSAFGG